MTSSNPRLQPNGQTRKFTPCDCARIARNCVSDNDLPAEEVLACIAAGLGFSHVAVERADKQKVVEAVVISKTTIKSGISLTKTFLTYLKNRYSFLAARIAAILEFIDYLERIVDLLTDAPETKKVEDAKGDNCNCKPVKAGGK